MGTSLKRIEGFFIAVTAPTSFFALEYTTDPFPNGTAVYANISLSEIVTDFFNTDQNPKFHARAHIVSWSVYLKEGVEGPRVFAPSTSQNVVGLDNCFKITFRLEGVRVGAKAQINVFTF